MHLFYTPELLGEYYTLNEQESKHCIKVLRLKAGDHIQLSDGKGNLFKAELISDNTRRCEVRIVETLKDFGKRDYRIHLAVAPTKNINRYEWFLEKATEIGIDDITPVFCQRSERKVVRNDRLEKVITSAMKQSIKAYHPVLHKPQSFKNFIKNDLYGEKYIAYIEEGDHPSLKSLYTPGKDVVVLIGPEGDFSPEEVKMAVEHGFNTVSLGKSRLRTETAAVVACHTVSLLNF
ncbi:MAG: 16S rRNA (uracil(1498)-N(3))-methyltransferase [Bacteroidales bacterium]|nr:16S rRNA (uracil(1498)-N(3))-methyltransferase [Bacteroidales bacterium]